MTEPPSDSPRPDERKPYVFACVVERPHLGKHLVDGARDLGLSAHVIDPRSAWRAGGWITRMCWHLLDKRAPRRSTFESEVRRSCDPPVGTLISTGVSQLQASTLREIGRRGVIRANFSTDDPWNPKNGARWFFRSLREYDIVFTPRRANIPDLNRLGCPRVEYLPFAYEPTIHFPEPPDQRHCSAFGCDVAFIGGADADRLPYVDALRANGLDVHVYGGGWEHYPRWRSERVGDVIDGDYRQAVAHARLQLCLVRRANRDGHVMRSFELPAMRSCILAEDTVEHRDIYGPPDAKRVAYFNNVRDMVAQAKRLLMDEPMRRHMAEQVFERVVHGSGNTYRDRMATMVEVIECERARRLPFHAEAKASGAGAGQQESGEIDIRRARP